MAKNTFADWDTVAANNTDIGGIAIVGTSPVANFDNALRTVMSQLKAGVAPIAGGTFTGPVTVPNTFTVKAATGTSLPLINFSRSDGTLAGAVFWDYATSLLKIRGYNTAGTTVLSEITLGTDGAAAFQYNAANVVTTAQTTGVIAATGSAPMYACRAWVNFQGSGTVTVRGSGNVSSITDNGAGDYTINFTTAMPDVNYAAVFGMVVNNTTSPVVVGENLAYSRTTSAIRVNVQNFATGSLIDWSVVQVAIFR
jgi:hypothetical protein